jgi:hypothetical protein
MNSSEKHNEILRIRRAATGLTNALEELQAAKINWTYLDMGNVLADNDFIEQNSGLTVTDLANVVGTTLTAIEALLAQGHGTNLYKIRIR